MTNCDYGGMNESETEHEVGENPDGNEDPQTGKTKFIESIQSCLRSPKSRDEQVECIQGRVWEGFCEIKIYIESSYRKRQTSD